MKVVIVGPGALGCLLAARLHVAARGRSVALLDYDPARAALLNRQGIILEDEESGGPGDQSPDPGRAAPFSPPAAMVVDHGAQPEAMVPVSTDPAMVADADLVLLCVKAPAFATALDTIAPLLPPSSLLLALQNGISHLEILNARKLSCAWGLGISTEGANLRGPGRVRSGGAGLTELGFTQPPTPEARRRLNDAVELLNHAGLRTTSCPDIIGRLWRKLIINAGINALSVIHDCPNGRLLEIPAARQAMAAAVREAAAVAGAVGVELTEDPVTLVEEICRQTATNISSMLQDIRRGKTTEIEAINGAIVRLAARHRMAVPVNHDLLTSIVERQRRPGPKKIAEKVFSQ
ncbi:MAG: ketopantoate reductase family protein [Desulfurivibrio sp.]